MAESSGGASGEFPRNPGKFEFEVSVSPRSKDKTKHDKKILARDLKYFLKAKELQKHVIENTELKNFFITGIHDVKAGDNSVTIVFAVHNINDWENFVKLYQTQLSVGIKSYLDSNQMVLSSFGAVPSTDNALIEIFVNLDARKLSKRAEEHFLQTKKKSKATERESKVDIPRHILANTKEKKEEKPVMTNVDVPLRHTSSSLVKETKEEKPVQTNVDMPLLQVNPTMIQRTFGIYLHTDRTSKILEISLDILPPYPMKVKLDKFKGFNIWLADVSMPSNTTDFSFSFRVRYEISRGVLYSVTHPFSRGELEDCLPTYYHTETGPVNIYTMYGCSPKTMSVAYGEMCSMIILRNANLNATDIIEELRIFQSSTERPELSNMVDVITIVQKHIVGILHYKDMCLVYLCFLSHLHDDTLSAKIRHLEKDFMEKILVNCRKLSLKSISLERDCYRGIPKILMDMYINCFRNRGSFIDFMFYTNTFLTEEQLQQCLFRSHVTRPGSYLELFNIAHANESSTLKSILLNLAKQISTSSSSKHAHDLFRSILRHIPFDELLMFSRSLQSCTTFTDEVISQYEETFVMKLKVEIKTSKSLHSLCEMYLKMKTFNFSQEPKDIIDLIEDSTMNAIRNGSVSKFEKFRDICLTDDGTLCVFKNIDKQICLLKILSESKDGDLHGLVLSLLDIDKFIEIPTDRGKEILKQWFEMATVYHCEAHLPSSPKYIPKMYAYLSSAIRTRYIKRSTDVSDTLVLQALSILEKYKVVDIVRSITEIEKSDDPDTEDIYRDHVQKIIQARNEAKSLSRIIREVTGSSNLCVHSRVTYGLCVSLMAISGMEEDISDFKVFEMMVDQIDFWLALFHAKGDLKEDLLKEKHMVKAANAVKQLSNDIMMKNVSLNFLECYRKKREDCYKLLEMADKKICSEIWKNIEDAHKVVDKFKTQLDQAVGIIENIWQNISEGYIKQSLSQMKTCLLKERNEMLSQNVTVFDIQSTDSFKTWLPAIEEPINCLQNVIKSTVFWNCIKMNDKFSDCNFLVSKGTALTHDKDPIEYVKFLFGETTEDQEPIEEFTVTSKLLLFLQEIGIAVFKRAWEEVCNGNISIALVQKYFIDGDVKFEMELAKTLLLLPIGSLVEMCLNNFCLAA